MKQLYCLLLLAVFARGQAQGVCSFLHDTVFVPKENKVLEADYLQATLKNKAVAQLFKTDGGKYYMKLIVTENLYFDKTDLLEVRSGNKSFFAKETRQQQYDNYSAYFMIEIFKNYVATLKDEGITAIVFGKSETKFSKTDCNQIKQISKCFYESIATKK